MAIARQTVSDFKGDHLSVKMYGAKCSAAVLTTSGGLPATSTTVTVPGHDFDDPPQVDGPFQGIEIAGAGAAGADYIGQVIAVHGNALTITPATATTVSSGASVKHEDTAAIQAALDSLTTGGELLFPGFNGVYRCRTITPLSNTVLVGQGGATLDIIDDATATGRSIFVNGVSNVTVRNLRITSVNATARTGLYGNIRIQDSDHVNVIDCDIDGSSSTGIHVINGSDLLFQGNTIRNTWADGIHVTRGSARVRVLGNTVTFCGDDGIGLVGYKYGGDVTYPIMTDITVIGNTINNLTKLVGRGISIHGVFGFVIKGNTISTVYDSGILIGAVTGDDAQATHYAHHGIIQGNTITDTGIGLDGARMGIFLSYCRCVLIDKNEIYNIPTDGISLSFVAKDIQVTNNDLGSIGGRGIIAASLVQTDARLLSELITDFGESASNMGISYVKIAGNTIRKTGATANAISIEIESAHAQPGFEIENNKIYSCDGTAIYTNYSNQSMIEGNRIVNPTGPGITVGGQNGSVVRGNSILSSGSYGIGFIIADNCLCIGNYVTDCDGGGIYSASNSTYILVTGNFTRLNTSFQVSLDNSVSNTSAAFNNFGDDYKAGDQTYYQTQPSNPYGIWIGGDPGVLTNVVKDYAGAGNPASGLGQIGSIWRDTGGGGAWYKKGSTEWINLKGFFQYVTGLTNQIRTIGGIDGAGFNCDPDPGIDWDFNGAVRAGTYRTGLSASRPMRTSAAPVAFTIGSIVLDGGTGEVTGTLPLNRGGTNATTASGARVQLDVYSKSEVDAAIALAESDLQTEIDAQQTELDDHEARITTLESNLSALQSAYATHGHTVYVTTVSHSHTDPQGGTTGTANVNEPNGTTSAPT